MYEELKLLLEQINKLVYKSKHEENSKFAIRSEVDMDGDVIHYIIYSKYDSRGVVINTIKIK